jgi:hypothetical protein
MSVLENHPVLECCQISLDLLLNPDRFDRDSSSFSDTGLAFTDAQDCAFLIRSLHLT